MGKRWSSLRASLNQNANEASVRWFDWYKRRRYVGKLPQLAFYLVCLAIAWWIGGPRLALIIVLISLAVGLATFGIGLIVLPVLVSRRRRSHH